MESLIQKIKSIALKFRTTKVSYERHSINPRNDWEALLTVTLVAICVITIVSFYFYIQIDRGKFFIIKDDSTIKEIKINTSLLKKTVDDISLRESLFLQIKNNKPNVADPSI